MASGCVTSQAMILDHLDDVPIGLDEEYPTFFFVNKVHYWRMDPLLDKVREIFNIP